jgi:limonene-1,2-epoxide hydrolase
MADPSAAEQPEQPEIRVVEAFFAALRAGETERALALMSEDVVYQNVPFPADQGKPAVRRTLATFGRMFTGFDVEMKNIAARNGVVLTERVDLLSGPFVDLEIWVCGTFEVKDGRITLWRDYFDIAQSTVQMLTGPIRKLFGRARGDAR